MANTSRRRRANAQDEIDDDDDDDDEEPQFELYVFEDDVWSLESKRAAKEASSPAPTVTPSAPREAAPEFEMFDAWLSLELANDLSKAGDVWEANRDIYPRFADLMGRIDYHAAGLLEDWLEEEAERLRDDALEQIRTAPRNSGRRLDGELVRQLVHIKSRSLSRRQREVYHFCFERNFSVNQCAKVLGIGSETVRTHLRRLRKQMPAAWCVPKSA